MTDRLQGPLVPVNGHTVKKQIGMHREKKHVFSTYAHASASQICLVNLRAQQNCPWLAPLLGPNLEAQGACSRDLLKWQAQYFKTTDASSVKQRFLDATFGRVVSHLRPSLLNFKTAVQLPTTSTSSSTLLGLQQ